MTATTSRTAAPRRWQDALERATSAGIVAFNVAGDPQVWFVTSNSAPGTGYLVTIRRGESPSCQCRAGEFDPVCQHRAVVLSRLGMLPRATSAPTSDREEVVRWGRRAKAELIEDA